MVKNPSANAGDSEDVGSVPASGRSPEKERAAWKILWTESLVDYSPWGHIELDITEHY